LYSLFFVLSILFFGCPKDERELAELTDLVEASTTPDVTTKEEREIEAQEIRKFLEEPVREGPMSNKLACPATVSVLFFFSFSFFVGFD
jgi:hypothetical protein